MMAREVIVEPDGNFVVSDAPKIQRQGKKWIVVNAGDRWISRKKFPAKWKAELALNVSNAEGGVSDYFAVLRAQKEKREQTLPIAG